MMNLSGNIFVLVETHFRSFAYFQTFGEFPDISLDRNLHNWVQLCGNYAKTLTELSKYVFPLVCERFLTSDWSSLIPDPFVQLCRISRYFWISRHFKIRLGNPPNFTLVRPQFFSSSTVSLPSRILKANSPKASVFPRREFISIPQMSGNSVISRYYLENSSLATECSKIFKNIFILKIHIRSITLWNLNT